MLKVEKEPNKSDQVKGSSETVTVEKEHEKAENPIVPQIVAHIRQNFGKINVVPEFSEADLLPVNISEDEDILDEEAKEEEEQGNEDSDGNESTGAELNKLQENNHQCVDKPKQTMWDLDEKIVKYKKLLDKAKAKRFSAIRIPKGLITKLLTQINEKTSDQTQKSTENGGRRRKRKAQNELDEEPPPKLSSKQRQRLDRLQHSKKVGVRYYETHNVKNKNKNKKNPASKPQKRKKKR
ncbi:nucleolar GTP-binding protein 2-like [Hypanus sabinus]|uniref:nucleolar GTP-binding protein 2-like n=1 Tax=Hypanus sabinus TaxID=79690 RepID=UPI0028C41959|nr:nucleolar GTP-binding protein 2-like [Hypanus sabinus]